MADRPLGSAVPPPAAGGGGGAAPEPRHLRVVRRRPPSFPVPLSPFVGREAEIAELSALLREWRLVTLTGSGGGGKTRLALETAGRLLGEYADGAAWAELASLADPALVPQAVAGTLQLRTGGGAEGADETETIAGHLRDRQLLLVLDNCEHLLATSAALARTLLERCPGLHILATSREPLHIDGERVWRVPPLSTPAGEEGLDGLMAAEAVQLFVERARAIAAGFELTEWNAPAVARICRTLEGIPLAIELAAARTQLLAPAQIADRLADAFRLLTLGSRDASPRQQTLRGAMDWSYDLLQPLERRLFERLAVFAGGFTLEAAEAVCAGDGIAAEEVLDTLTRLVDRSLVVVAEDGGEARCRLLETVRQYAAERLAHVDGAEPTAARHAGYYTALVERGEAELVGPRQAAAMDRLEAEHDNLRAALRWQVSRGDAAGAARLAGSVWRFWQTRGYLAEGRRWLREVLALRPPTGANPQAALAWSAARPRALQGAGVLAWGQGEYDEARALFQESLADFERLGEEEGVAALRNNLGVIALHRADYAEATRLFEASLDLRRRQGNRLGIATLLNNLGATAGKQGELAQALRYYEEALQLQRELGNTHGAAITLSNLGATAFDQGDHPQARRYLQEGLELRRLLGDRTGVADSFAKLARLALRAGDGELARAHYAESLELLAELLDRERLAAAMVGVAALALAHERPERAARLLGGADALRAAIGAPLTADERGEHERLSMAVRDRLGEPAFATLHAEGAALPLESALELARAEVPRAARTPQDDGAPAATQAPLAGAAGVERRVGAGDAAARSGPVLRTGPGGRSGYEGASPAAPAAAEPSSPELCIHALGRLEVLRGGHQVTAAEWGSAKPRELLFYLLAHPEGRTKEQVGLALWPDASPAQLRNSFHVTLHHLRRALGRAEWVVYEGDRYRFDRSLAYEYDVEQFEGWLDEAQRLRSADAATDAGVVECIERALLRWRGELLEDTLFGDWHLELRDRLRRRRTDALLLLGELRLEAGDPAAAGTAFRQLLSEDRLIERAHRGLMLSLARQGESDRALAHYRVAEALLREELGTAPSPETVALVERLRAGTPL